MDVPKSAECNVLARMRDDHMTRQRRMLELHVIAFAPRPNPAFGLKSLNDVGALHLCNYTQNWRKINNFYSTIHKIPQQVA